MVNGESIVTCDGNHNNAADLHGPKQNPKLLESSARHKFAYNCADFFPVHRSLLSEVPVMLETCIVPFIGCLGPADSAYKP
jgi:hypothetical protein